jgi:hypothetical protein
MKSMHVILENPETSLRTEVKNAWRNASTLFFAVTVRSSYKHMWKLNFSFTANTLFCHYKTLSFLSDRLEA